MALTRATSSPSTMHATSRNPSTSTPAHHRRAVNNFVGEFHGGSLMQIGGDYHGDIRL